MSLAVWGRVLSEGVELPPARVRIEGTRITSIEPAPGPEEDDLRAPENGWIAPGFIDVQVNGAGGVDLTSADDPATALDHVAGTLAQHGVTAFCPTIVSSPVETILKLIPAYSKRAPAHGAESLGIHVEGPFIDPHHRGVHDPRVLRTATHDEIEKWLDVGTPAIVTLAPELPGAAAAIENLAARNVVVSLGHSAADVEQTRRALERGARMATHLFNAMPPLHHREPGLVGALLASNAALGLIADGVHVHPLVVDLVIRVAGAARVVLVSDMLAAAAAPPGESLLGDQVVISDGRQVRRADGTLAGSAMLLPECVRNVHGWLPNLPPATLIDMATRTPADLLGASHKGRIRPGCDADLVLLDASFAVQTTILRGERVA